MSMKTILLAAAVSLSTLTAAHAAPVELVANGGFESGSLSGWTAVSNNGTNGCGSNVWTVNSTGSEGCGTVAAPTSGKYAAYNTFDGQAGAFTLTQQIVVPGSVTAATLSFLDEFYTSYSGTARTFNVAFYDATGTTLLGTVASQTPATSGTTGWKSTSVNVTAILASQAGNTVDLRFTETIPQSYTGPGGFGLDNISLQADVPEPGSLALMGLGLLGFVAARRKSAKN